MKAKTHLFEDGGGADFIEIKDYKDGTYRFEVGSRCTFVLRKTGTISEITDWLFDITKDLDREQRYHE